MKKLNNYLLTHCPLFWNLRLHWLWPTVLLLHLLFWLAGYSAVSFPENYGYYALDPGGATYLMAVLCGLLLLALWLVFYFRNNAFKNFYPLAKGRLVAEFGLLLLTAFGLCTFVGSYAGGSYYHIRRDAQGINVVAEANTANLAQHFLPFVRSKFSVQEDCNYVRKPHQAEVNSPDMPPVADTTLATHGSGTITDTFSYLHYCENSGSYYYNYYRHRGKDGFISVRTPEANDTIAKRWLYGGQRDSVAQVLYQFLTLCKKYRAEYQYDVPKGVSEIFATPGFLVRGIISSDSYTATHFEENNNNHEVQLQPGSYMNTRTVTEALSTVSAARIGWLDARTLLVFLYFSLGIALLIFSFRATSVQVWFIALIGMAVWMAFFGVVGAMSHGDEKGIMTIFLLLSAGFLIAGAVLIRARSARRNAGVATLWALWSFPALALFVVALIEKASRPLDEEYGRNLPSIEVTHPVYYWISNHWTLINYYNLLLTLLAVCLFFIPLLRRWQAAPEE